MNTININLSFIIILYTYFIIKYLLEKDLREININTIKYWFYKKVSLTETNTVTRTSDLFKSYTKFINLTTPEKKDLILFGKLFKTFIKQENLPLLYKKGTYAGYTNIKSVL